MTPRCSNMYHSRLVRLVIVALHLSKAPVSHVLTLTTQSSIRGVSVQQLQTFLSTPTTWTTILISENSVQPVLGSKYAANKPLRKGEQVRGMFGLPPFSHSASYGPATVMTRMVSSSCPQRDLPMWHRIVI